MLDFWTRLPGWLRNTLKTILTAGLSGGVTALSSVVIDPEHFNLQQLRRVGIVFAAGALIGIINWLRQEPWKRRDDLTISPYAQHWVLFAAACWWSLVAGLLVVTLVSCGPPPPPSLSPAGTQAYQADRVVKVVNDVVTAAKTANRAPFPIGGFILSDRETSILLRTCDGILQTIAATPRGYVDAVRKGLVLARSELTEGERARVAPYLERISAILDEVYR